MYKLFLKIFYTLFIFPCLLNGCYSNSDFDFDRPYVVSATPSHNTTFVPADTNIIIDFSKSMDTVKTDNEFSLGGDSGKIDGVFKWENGDTRLIFTPREDLPASDHFTVRITKSAEDTEGNDLKNEFVSAFYVSGENETPYVVSYTPAANSLGNPTGTIVSITFSEPVELNSIYNGISISPSIQGLFRWNAGAADSTVITFKPLYGFNSGVTYTVNVSDSILDISGNKLREPVTFNFTAGDDFVKPGLAVYQDLDIPLNFDEALITHGAEKDKRLVLEFSERVCFDNLRNAISISPSTEFYINSENSDGATTAYINFTDHLLCDETYTLRVNSSITDIQGNPLVKDYRFVFKIDGAGSIAPVVGEIGDLVPVNPLPALQHWLKDDVQILLIQNVPLFYQNIVTDFISGIGGEAVPIDPLSLSLSVEIIAGNGSGVSVINVDWPAGSYTKFSRLKFGLYNITSGNIYKIVIKGGKNGLRDVRGNFMKDDFVQMVKF